MIVEEYKYSLRKKIDISDSGRDGTGEMITVDAIVLVAPSRNNARAASGLMRLVHKSLSSKSKGREPTDAEKKKAEEDKKIDKDKPIRELFPASDVVNILAGSELSGNTLDEAYGYLTSLLTGGCGLMNDKSAKDGDLGKLGLHDWNNILGEYVSNFLSDSLFE